MRIQVVIAMALATAASAQECRLLPLSPSQPPLKVEEGERATESQTFQTNALALSGANEVHFFDAANRIRRIDSDGRIVTVAGNGERGETVVPGPARDNPLPAVGQIVFSQDNVLHFTAAGRVYRLVDGRIEVVAGSGRPGFNGEEMPAMELNLGNIVKTAFMASGRLIVIDSYNRVRQLDPDGYMRTIAGSTRPASSNGFTGDNGPARQASLSSPRQIVPLRDGSLWINDLSGRHLRLLTPDGVIRTINQNFDASVNILQFPDGTPGAATANRVYPFRSNGTIETGGNPFPPFTGTPLAIGSGNTLFFAGSARPEQRNPLVRMAGTQTVIAGAPVAATVDGQSPPFGAWHPRRNTLLYSASQDGKSGILEVTAGQAPKFVVGGGSDIGSPEGKDATSISIFGIVAFTVDGEGRIIVADVFRRRLWVVGADGKASILKTSSGDEYVYATLGSFSSLQRIAADQAGNIYWFQQGGTPAGGIFTAEVAVWSRADSSIRQFTVPGFSGVVRLEDGTVAVMAGPGSNFRTAYRVNPSGQAEMVSDLRGLPLQSITRLEGFPFFTAASRLFRGAPGTIEMLDLQTLPDGTAFTPDFLLTGRDGLLVHLTNGGFYGITGMQACRWVQQPVIASVVNAASYEYANQASVRQLLTIYGSGLGPAGGQGTILDGVLRATGQPAPYPALTLGNFAANQASLSGTVMPVMYSDDRQVSVQAPSSLPTATYVVYFSWQGLQLVHPAVVRPRPATPGLFGALNADGSQNSAENPAAGGTVVTLMATGLGALDTNLATGEFAGENPVRVTNPVTALLGSATADVEFAGTIPGMIGGVLQVRAMLPEGIEAGEYPLTVEVAGQTSAEARLYVK